MLLKLSKDLSALRSETYRLIDSSAEELRLTFITPGDGQAMAYQQKRLEAELYLADVTINPALIPHIVQEAAIDGSSLLEQATRVVVMFYQWQQVSALIETVRLKAKLAVRSAVTPAEIGALAVVDWSPVLRLANSS